MAKIKAEEKLKVVPFTVRMREDWLAKLTAYCHYLSPESPSTPGYVLTECFKQICERDADFASFLQTFTPKPDAKSDARNGKTRAVRSAA